MKKITQFTGLFVLSSLLVGSALSSSINVFEGAEYHHLHKNMKVKKKRAVSSSSTKHISGSDLETSEDDICATKVFKIGESNFESSIKRQIEGYIPQIFKVICTTDSGGHTGTAWMFDASRGILATNHHVIPPDYGIYSIETRDGKRYKKDQVKIIGLSPSTQYGDFGFIQIPALAGKFPQMPMLYEHTVAMHEPVAFMGNSYGSFSVEEGNVNTLYDFSMDKVIESFHIQLMCRGGASGSPTYNRNGQIIGILYAGDDIHSIVHPIWFVKRAYDIMMNGEVFRPISLKSFHATFDVENVDDIVNFHGVTEEFLEKYVVDSERTRNSLLCFTDNYKISKDHDDIRTKDVLLTVNGECVGCNTIKITQILDSTNGFVSVGVLRMGKVYELNILPEYVEQEYSKYLEISEDSKIYSRTSGFFDFRCADHLPIISIVDIDMSTIESLSESQFLGVVSKINNVCISTFNEFLVEFYNQYGFLKKEYFMLEVLDRHGSFQDVVKIDKSTDAKLLPKVVYFDKIEKKWNKKFLLEYINDNDLM